MQGETPVSVIMASYNYAGPMCEAIDSVLAQTHSAWELLIVDDGSKDDSVDVIRAYAQKDPRIRLIQHPDKGNHGLAATVQLGIAEAQYSVTAFLEADDIWLPKSLELRLACMGKTGAGMVSSHCALFGDGERREAVQQYIEHIRARLLDVAPSPYERKLLFLCDNNYIPTFSVVMVRTDALRQCDFASPVPQWLDYWLWAQLIWVTPYAFVPEPLTLWRIHGGSYNSAENSDLTLERFKSFHRALQSKVRQEVLARPSRKDHVLVRIGTFLGKTVFSRSARISLKAYKLVRACLRKKERALLQQVLSRFTHNIHFLQELEASNRTKEQEVAALTEEQPFFTAFFRAAEQEGTPEYRAMHAEKRILFIIHELSLTGAPLVTLEAARVARKNGMEPVFLAFRGGAVCTTLRAEGVPYVIEPRLEHVTSIPVQRLTFFNQFDAILLSSVACTPIFRVLKFAKPKKYWWVHETAEGFFYADQHADLPLADCVAEVDQVWLGSPLSHEPLLKHCPGAKSRLLVYGVRAPEQDALSPTLQEGERIRFSMVGSLIPRKGQLLFLEAIATLPEECRQRASFEIIGEPYTPDPFSDYTEAFKKRAASMPDIRVLPQQSHDVYLESLNKAHVLVCPSTDDPMPVVVTEALALGKTCICSDAIGQAAILRDGQDMLTFPSGDVKALAAVLRRVIEDPSLLQHFAEPARRAFAAHFSMSRFEAELMQALQE